MCADIFAGHAQHVHNAGNLIGMDSDSDSDDSVLSEGARAANDRLAPKTQRDYSVYIKQLTRFACHLDRRAEFADCLNGNEVIMPVALKLGKAFVVSLRDKLVPWPMDGRPEGERTYLKHYSCSKINNACLAIKNTFRKLSQPVPFADASFYLDFAQSYGQIIAREKGVGAYPAVEGSIALGSAQIKKVINAAFRYVPEAKAQSARRSRKKAVSGICLGYVKIICSAVTD